MGVRFGVLTEGASQAGPENLGKRVPTSASVFRRRPTALKRRSSNRLAGKCSPMAAIWSSIRSLTWLCLPNSSTVTDFGQGGLSKVQKPGARSFLKLSAAIIRSCMLGADPHPSKKISPRDQFEIPRTDCSQLQGFHPFTSVGWWNDLGWA